MIKKALLATTCIVALTGAAGAADLPLKSAAPAYLPVNNWTGPYIGGHVGVARMNSSCTQTTDGGGNYAYYGQCQSYYGGASTVATDTAITAGAEIGYDWQDRYFVYGVAADWSWTNLNRSVTSYHSSPTTFKAKIDWLASFRGRAGLAVDNTLVYLTGGFALAHVKGENLVVSDFGPGNYGNLSSTRVGWVAGLGVEHKFTQNWSAKAEFLYYDLGRETGTTTYGSTTYATQYNFDVMTARLGINYRF
jgi:outer membrane immunogenic protein